jgi:alpha-ketoglutarate-dependent taurine dioxygenase
MTNTSAKIMVIDPAPTRPAVLRKSFKVEYCTPAIGAEVTGVRLEDIAGDPGLVREIRQLWLERRVLFFRDQNVTPMNVQSFAEKFGELEAHPSLAMHPDAPMILPLFRNLDPSKKSALEKNSRENIWHNDLTYIKIPTRGAVLACELCPDCGGDTMWANMALAYEKLPIRIKERLDGLFAKHSSEQVFGAQMPRDVRFKYAQKLPMVEHPVVITHPETNEKVLFVNRFATSHFSNFYNFKDVRYGNDLLEASTLLNYLVSQASIPEFQVRLKWRPGTVAMWDNLFTQRYALSDYDDQPRKMLRATFKRTPVE